MKNAPHKTSSVEAIRNLFAFILVVVILCIGGLLFLAFQKLPAYAATVNQKLEQADLAPEKTQASDTAQIAQHFFTTPGLFVNQADRDIKAYAAQTHIPIQSVTADSSVDSGVVVQIGQPVSYDDLLSFLQLIESNVPKMTIASIKITRSGTASPALVTVSSFTIKVAVR